jgi:hypothetical protein
MEKLIIFVLLVSTLENIIYYQWMEKLIQKIF